MGDLARKRCDFTEAKLRLELWFHAKGQQMGFKYAIGEAKRPWNATYGHPKSTHKVGLAVHFMLYNREYEWLHEVDPELEHYIYTLAHNHWDTIGGAPRIEKDLNHFSFMHNGVR